MNLTGAIWNDQMCKQVQAQSQIESAQIVGGSATYSQLSRSEHVPQNNGSRNRQLLIIMPT